MQERGNQSVTEIVKIPNRGHSLTIDSGWREVAEKALAFVKRFVTTDAIRRPGAGGQTPDPESSG